MCLVAELVYNVKELDAQVNEDELVRVWGPSGLALHYPSSTLADFLFRHISSIVLAVWCMLMSSFGLYPSIAEWGAMNLVQIPARRGPTAHNNTPHQRGIVLNIRELTLGRLRDTRAYFFARCGKIRCIGHVGRRLVAEFALKLFTKDVFEQTSKELQLLVPCKEKLPAKSSRIRIFQIWGRQDARYIRWTKSTKLSYNLTFQSLTTIVAFTVASHHFHSVSWQSETGPLDVHFFTID